MLLEVENLSVHYGKAQALHKVDLAVAPGELVAVLGSNGAGKTTLLRAVSGLARVTAGRILLGGELLLGVPPHVVARRGVAHVPQGRQIIPDISVEWNLLLAARAGGGARGDVKEFLEQEYRRFPVLEQKRHLPAGSLSGGEQQMLAISRALVTKPKLLMLDEPSLGLAPIIVDRIFRSIRELNACGLAVLLVEQAAAAALDACDRAYVLRSGQVAATGTGQDLKASREITNSYLGEH